MVAPSVFESVTSIAMLRRGFDRVCRNDGCPGGDGVTVRMFGVGIDFRLVQLQQALRSGSYQPKPVAVFEVPKSGRPEKRVLRVPSVVDRVAQTAAYFVLQEMLKPEFEEYSFGYRLGRSTKMAISAVHRLHAQGYRWVLDADIRANFDNVPHLALLAKLSDYVAERKFLDLVRLWLGLSERSGFGLPQGAPISPILANLYLDHVDEEIAEAGFHMVRYADDFVILCRSTARAEKALGLVSQLLHNLKLELHPEKTAIRPVDEGYAFFGERIRGTTLSKQVEELGEEAIPKARSTDEHDTEEIEGALRVPGSRRIMGADRDFGGTIAISGADVSGLDTPWQASDDSPYAVEGDEPLLPVGDDEAEARRKSHYAPFIRPLYIREKRRRLETHQAGYAIMEGEACLAIVAPGTIDRIDLFPGVDISTEAMRQAAQQHIPIFFNDGRGTTLATLAADDRHRSRLHLAQARHALDPVLSLALGRRFVDGRIFNERRLIQRLRGRLGKERKKERDYLKSVIDGLDHYQRRAANDPSVADVNEVCSIEASAGSLYWPALSSLVKRGFGTRHFRRTRMPPESAFNAVLNYTAYLLRKDIETLLLGRGLHPGFGVLHTVNDAQSGCVFDLMEEFRAPIAEASAALLLSTGELGAKHFDELPVGDRTAIHIVDEGGSIVIRGYERHIDNRIDNPITGERTTWRGMMDYQLTRYIRHVLGVEDYEPYRLYL